MQTSDSSISAFTLPASPVADKNPISPHTRPSIPDVLSVFALPTAGRGGR
jgi:hypothetical protein